MNETSALQESSSRKDASLWEFFRAVVGNFLLLLLVVGAERLFFEQGYYSSLIQHPFWIIVLIAAVHDGLFVGVLIAVASMVLMDWPTRPAEVDITAHYIQVAVLPLQWLLAALCIGLYRQAELRTARAAAAEMARLQHVNEVLAADIIDAEAQISRTQLESLSRDETLDCDGELVGRILALQGADFSNLAHHFDLVAELCTSLPARILMRNTEGAFEFLDAEHTDIKAYEEPHFDKEQMQSLRTTPLVVALHAASFDQLPDYQFKVVVGVTSPGRRTLHGAVELLAKDNISAERAVNSARFLAIQLAPVLARIRMPTLAVPANTSLPDDRVRRWSHG